jgi:asparaginyl-tRNA synthetase
MRACRPLSRRLLHVNSTHPSSRTVQTRWLHDLRHRRFNVAQLLEQNAAQEQVELWGWIRSVRKQKRIAFAVVGDGSTTASVQAVLQKPDQASE